MSLAPVPLDGQALATPARSWSAFLSGLADSPPSTPCSTTTFDTGATSDTCATTNSSAPGFKPPGSPGTSKSGNGKKKDRVVKPGRTEKDMKAKVVNRMHWTNEMVSELLCLRFADGEVKRRLETADTKTKTSLALQLFASVLSQSRGMVIKQEQASRKYRKLKCMYRKEKREANRTGNNTSDIGEIDDDLWSILNDAFASRADLSGDILMDAHPDEETEDGTITDVSDTSRKSNLKGPPVVQLASALQSGIEAIAVSMSSRSEADDPLRALTSVMQRQHEETQRLHQLQLQLLQRLVERQ